jgi:hypothetical protein
VYRYLDATPPINLDEPIKQTKSILRLQNPVHTISPQINGKGGDYFDWLSAGRAVPAGGDSMHRTDRLFEKVLFGFDPDNLYLKLDLASARMSEFPETSSIRIHFISPKEGSISLEHAGKWSCRILQWPSSRNPVFAGDKVLELAIPLDAIGVRQPEDVNLFILALDSGREIERFPTTGLLTIHTNPWTLDQQDWVV